jgi:hypothetical protein
MQPAHAGAGDGTHRPLNLNSCRIRTGNILIILRSANQRKGSENAEAQQIARRDQRPAFDELWKDAGACKFDIVLAWSVDRIGRSLKDLVGFLAELHALNIDLFLKQQGIDTTTPAGKAMLQMLGVFAEFERSMIQKRVRAGLERARRAHATWPPSARPQDAGAYKRPSRRLDGPECERSPSRRCRRYPPGSVDGIYQVADIVIGDGESPGIPIRSMPGFFSLPPPGFEFQANPNRLARPTPRQRPAQTAGTTPGPANYVKKSTEGRWVRDPSRE